jgi:chromosomal replication initiator protein
MRAWEEFLASQEKELGRETVQKWLRPLKVVRFDACNLYLEAADAFKVLWFEEHVRHRVQKALFNNNSKKIKVHLAISPLAKMDENPSTKKQQKVPLAFRLNFDELDDKCRFDNFLVSDSNILAYKILAEAAFYDPKTGKITEIPCKHSPSYNPIFIFGRSGTGKTHLLQAATASLKQRGVKALFVRAETFTEHVVNAIRTGEMQMFRKTYRSIDLLLIDDIEVFSKKAATQEEFFHTFNTLHLEGKQIILSASSTPQELKFIEPRLISRFEWGIVVPIQRLEKEKMKHLLLKKAETLNFSLNDEILEFLVLTFGNNTKSLLRSLEALILRIHLNYELRGRPLTEPLIKKILSDLIIEEEKTHLTPDKIIRAVADYYGIRTEDILSKSQSRECALPRQIAMHLCRNKLNLPYMKIGDIFSRDHSTVMSSVKQIQTELDEKGSEISANLNCIMKRLEV